MAALSRSTQFDWRLARFDIAGSRAHARALARAGLLADDELGARIGEGIGITADDVRHLEPLPTQTLNDEEKARLANLGKNGPRDVTGLVMTHCVPNERVVVGG